MSGGGARPGASSVGNCHRRPPPPNCPPPPPPLRRPCHHLSPRRLAQPSTFHSLPPPPQRPRVSSALAPPPSPRLRHPNGDEREADRRASGEAMPPPPPRRRPPPSPTLPLSSDSSIHREHSKRRCRRRPLPRNGHVYDEEDEFGRRRCDRSRVRRRRRREEEDQRGGGCEWAIDRRPFHGGGSSSRSNATASSSSVSTSTSTSTSASSCRTSSITHRSTTHGRARRHQRNIPIRSLQAAMKYGIARKGFPRRSDDDGALHATTVYEHDGITYVVDDVTREEVTSYVNAIVPERKCITDDDVRKHVEASVRLKSQLFPMRRKEKRRLRKDSGAASSTNGLDDDDDDDDESKIGDTGAPMVTSHSVLLVDTSGSMRCSDVHGSKTRLSAVWLSVAIDFVKQRIESGNACETDAVTIVAMGETARVLDGFDCAPNDWVLYNKLIDLCEGKRCKRRVTRTTTTTTTTVVRPRGHGCYVPALRLAERILLGHEGGGRNEEEDDGNKDNDRDQQHQHQLTFESSASASASASLLLGILSDGRPSDAALNGRSWTDTTQSLSGMIERLASRLGRRLTVATIGIGSGRIFSSSLPFNHHQRNKKRKRRRDGDGDGDDKDDDNREGRLAKDEETFGTLKVLATAATAYGCKGSFQLPSLTTGAIGTAVSSLATSLTASQTELRAGGGGGAAAADDRRDHRGDVAARDLGGGGRPNDELPSLHQRRVRSVLREKRTEMCLLTEVVDPSEYRIYMHDDVDRHQYASSGFRRDKLQHPDARGVGLKRTIFGEGVERYCHQFFEVAEDGETVVGDPLVAKESRFIEDHELLLGGGRGGGEANYEDRDRFAKRFCRLQHQARDAAQAFNARLDDIKSLDPDTARVSFLDCSVYILTDNERGSYSVIVERRLHGQFRKWNSNSGWVRSQRRDGDGCDGGGVLASPLVAIKEEEERDVPDEGEQTCYNVDDDTIFVTHNEVAQAFSHFSYVHSCRKMLICDLQGVYDKRNGLLRLTDPAIHYHNVEKSDMRGKYGRTDKGQKGIDDFFKSHVCNGLCDLVTKGFITPPSVHGNRHVQEASNKRQVVHVV